MISFVLGTVMAFTMMPSVSETAPCLCASPSQAELGGHVVLAIVGILYGVYKLHYEDAWHSPNNAES